VHPKETDLARLADLNGEAGEGEHLDWCSQCRSRVADYRWLQGEIASALSAVAAAVPVPRPAWWAVEERLLAAQRRANTGRRATAVATVVLTAGLLLSVSLLASTPAAGEMAAYRATMTPVPAMAVVPEEYSPTGLTRTPGTDTETPSATPVFVQAPTPSESEV
jgi:hypothetical protein